MKLIPNSICAPQGFLSAGVHAGVKKNSTKKDITLIYSETPAVAAGVFTLNQAKAAPLILTEEHLSKSHIQAVVVNSGNANACTGEKGMEDAKHMAKAAATVLDIPEVSVAVSSTGVIGVPLPIEKVISGIQLAATELMEDDKNAIEAILTTDTFPKSIAVEFELDGKIVRIGGIAKGSGMIHPMMATMLGFITTDIAISQEALKKAVVEANDDSFNMITVDGDTSTNDMLLVLANGLAKNEEISDTNSLNWGLFKRALTFVCTELAKLIAKDGEGATKLIEVQVTNAKTKQDARIAARAVCKSSLVKSAIFGEDANWGRIVSAIGASGIHLNLTKLSVYIADLCLFERGKPLPFDEEIATKHLQQKMVYITADLGEGDKTATAWGCDLTYDYVKINADYRS